MTNPSVEVLGDSSVLVEVLPPPIVEVEVLTGGVVVVGGTDGVLESNERIAAETMSALRVAAINDDGQLVYADASNPDHAYRVAGLLSRAISIGGTDKVLAQGPFTDESWNWEPGAAIYLGVNGSLTQSPPVSGFLMVLGQAITAQSIYFQKGEPIFL